MFNDNKNFYPTPKHVIRKMIEPFVLKDEKGRTINSLRSMQILEPSAGKGDILDFLVEEYGVKKSSLYAIEKDPELQYTLQGKDYKVIGNDFLDYFGDYQFHLIIANPPFDQGDKHLLRMWEVIENGNIICLLNAETIRNPHTSYRQHLAKIIKDHGSYEFIGSPFVDAERKTEVETVIVRLQKQGKRRFDFDFKFENVTKEQTLDFSEKLIGDKVALNDQTGNLLRCYQMTKTAFYLFLREKAQLEFYAKPILNANTDIFSIANAAIKDGNSQQERFNLFLDNLKFQAWREILRKMNIEKYLTNGVLKNFNDFAKNQGSLDLTKENIHNLVMMIIQNRDNIMKKAIVDVFDIFTKYHKENREHVEGWVTNESWIVGSKIILPYYIEMGYSGYFTWSHRRWDEFLDIEKVLCYIEGIDYEEMGKAIGSYDYRASNRDKEYVRVPMKIAIEKTPIGSTQWTDSEFFLVRCFKKGTIHLKWKSEELRAKFNQLACDGKFNLGYSPKKKGGSK
jgi:hypothetical protein